MNYLLILAINRGVFVALTQLTFFGTFIAAPTKAYWCVLELIVQIPFNSSFSGFLSTWVSASFMSTHSVCLNHPTYYNSLTGTLLVLNLIYGHVIQLPCTFMFWSFLSKAEILSHRLNSRTSLRSKLSESSVRGVSSFHATVVSVPKQTSEPTQWPQPHAYELGDFPTRNVSKT